MNEEQDDAAAPEPAASETPSAELAATALSGKGKAFWAGVGIGSAAIIAAVMYARRPKKRK